MSFFENKLLAMFQMENVGIEKVKCRECESTVRPN